MKISALKVDDESFLIASLIDRCPRVMMLRELVKNGIEAASSAPPGKQVVRLQGVMIGGVRKLAIWNTGPGMSRDELHRMCDIAASIRKQKGLDANFGMGAKVASLAANPLGMRYRSCCAGRVHEVTIGKRDGDYGRIKRLDQHGDLVDIQDVTAVVEAEGIPVIEDWTEVVLWGHSPGQDTVRAPYNGDPVVNEFWVPETLYHRFWTLPEGLEVWLGAGLHGRQGEQRFRAMGDRLATDFTTYEAAEGEDGLKVHYIFDPAHPERRWENRSADTAVQSSTGCLSLVYRGEMYRTLTGPLWATVAPVFGVTSGARHFSLHVELPDYYPVLPDAYRQFLRRAGDDQAEVRVEHFADTVRAWRPDWLVRLRKEMEKDSQVSPDIYNEIEALMSRMGIGWREELERKRREAAERAAATRQKPKGKPGKPSKPKVKAAEGITEPKALAKRLKSMPDHSLAPRILLLRDEADIEDRWLRGRAAAYYPDLHLLVVNALFSNLLATRKRLAEGFKDAGLPELTETVTCEVAERWFVRRVSSALIYALSKRLDTEAWHPASVETALSAEALTIAAEDFEDVMPLMRREVGERLAAAAAEAGSMAVGG